MRIFECQHCGQPLYFENTRCESCDRRLGYHVAGATITAVEPAGDHWRALIDPARPYRFCANALHDTCNWLVPADSRDQFCAACRYNRTIPDLSVPQNAELWRKIELAKHRLFYTLLKLRLPLNRGAGDPDGLAFDFITAGTGQVMTGHASGLITINLAEADDAERERQRSQMHEPYRTLVGHFRHEIGHYYWDRLIRDAAAIEDFRRIFGDERQDYQAALQTHYANGPPRDWPNHFVTAYASAHPWEDFAETWAHIMHLVDTLETASAFGMRVRPQLKNKADLSADIDFDPHDAGMHQLIDAWLPLTFAFNSINRSMGLPDLYPFVLSPPVIAKLTYVHDLIRAAGGREPSGDRTLQAMVAGLKRKVPETPYDAANPAGKSG